MALDWRNLSSYRYTQRLRFSITGSKPFDYICQFFGHVLLNTHFNPGRPNTEVLSNENLLV